MRRAIQQRFAAIGGGDRRQGAASPEAFGKIGKPFHLCPQAAPRGQPQIDQRIELDRPHRLAGERGRALFDQTSARPAGSAGRNRSATASAVGTVGDSSEAATPGRMRYRARRSHPRRSGQGKLHQEEALQAAGIDHDRSAIGDVVDGEAVEGRTIVQRREMRRRRLQRLELMGTEDPSDLLGRLIDTCRGDATKARQPCRPARAFEPATARRVRPAPPPKLF